MLNEMPELKAGMVIKYEDGTYYIIVKNEPETEVKINSIFKFNTNTFAYKMGNKINFNDLELIWERKPEIDWSNVAVDTKVLVRYSDSEQWGKRYFAKYENNIPFVFEDGCTSFSAGKTDNWFSEARQIVLYEGNESLVGE